MKADVRPDPQLYSPGAGVVLMGDAGRQLTHAEAIKLRDYHLGAIESSRSSERLGNNRRRLAQLEAAIAASFGSTQQQQESAA